nr:putative ribonuclease H-like domain-containing protein [Tanacetum cinerariifolium]
MRIKLYFLMTDYPLWEVILNGDSPAPTRVIKGVVQLVAPTTAKQRLARKSELKAHGTLLMALLDKHQLKFNIHKDDKTLMEAIKKRSLSVSLKFLENLSLSLSQKDINLKFLRSLPNEWRTHILIWRNKRDLEEQSLDDMFNSLKIYKAGVKSSSFASTSTQNIAFVSSCNTDSTNEPISVSAVSAKIPVSALPNVDTLSNAVIYSFFASQSNSPQLNNDDLKQIDADDLEEIDRKLQMAMLTVRARRFLHRTGRNLGANRPTSMGFDMSKVECYNCHRKGHFLRECRSPKDTRRNAMTGVFKQKRNLPTMLLWPLLIQVLLLTMRYQSKDGYHVVPLPFTGTFMPPKPDLVVHTTPNDVETVHIAFNVELSPTKPDNDLSHTHRPSTPIIEDWVSDSEDDSKTKIPQIVPSFVQPTEHVKAPRPSVQHVETSIPTSNPKTAIPMPTSNGNRRNKKACFGNLQYDLKDKGVIASRYSRHMTGNMSYLSDFEELNGGYVAFGGNPKGGKISGKGKIRTGKLDFDDVYFVKELKFNLFSVSQMCDKKNNVLFTDIECLVLSLECKPPDENQVLLRVLRENNMYNVNLKNIVPSGDLTCLFAKVTLDESNLWHRRLGYINFKTMNKLVKGNLVRGLPTKVFENDHTYVACKKGKKHRASCKTKPVSSVTQPLQRLHMDLFGPTFIKSLNKKSYCLGVTDDYSRFTWVFFLATNDETSPILKTFFTGIENQLGLKDEAVNTACYVQNRVLVTKPQNKTYYELLHCRTPSIGFMRSFGCLVTILNTLDSLGKFDGKVDEGFLVGYSVSSKAFKEPKFEGRKPQSEVHVSLRSSAQSKKHDDKTKREAKGKSHVESLTGYRNLSSKKHDDKTKREAKGKSPVESLTGYRNLSVEFEDFSINSINEDNATDSPIPAVGQISTNNTNTFSAVGPSNVAVSPTQGKSSYVDFSQLLDDPNMLELEDITYSDDEDDVGAEVDFTNLKTTITKVWVLVDLPHGKRAIAYASFMGFMVYQMDVKSAFLYGTSKEEVYVCQPLGFEDRDYPDKVYKVVKVLYGLHQAPRA